MDTTTMLAPAHAALAPARLLLGPTAALLQRMDPRVPRSRVSATPAPSFAAGLAYHSFGAGEPLLLVHGLTSSRAAFQRVAEELANDYHVILVDLPGHGDSPPLVRGEPLTPRAQAHALGEFLDALNIDSVHVAGNSMGGWVALELAADGRARSVIGLCPAGLWYPITSRSRAIEINRRLARLTGKFSELLMYVPPIREAVFASVLERPYRVDVATAQAILSAQRAARGYDEAHDGLLHGAFERADRIPADVAVTLAFGDNDPLLPSQTCQLTHLAPSHARWVVLPRVGHAPMWEDPEATVDLIRRTATADDLSGYPA
jgi:pimeloyl-ACP methyl ester carboxylesterase